MSLIHKKFNRMKQVVQLVAKKEVCYFCKRSLEEDINWKGGDLNITFHHKDNDHNNNAPENLTYAHSNCHKSYTLKKRWDEFKQLQKEQNEPQ